MRAFFNPRLLLLIWLGLGAAGLLYVILASSLSVKGPATPEKSAAAEVFADPALLVGEVEEFRYAFPPRMAAAEPFWRDGAEVSLADFRGKAVLVNFWATWCTPCLKELPSLDQLQADLGGDDFAVVAVAADPLGEEVAQRFFDKLDIRRLELYTDPQLRFAIASGGSSVLPVSILFDAQGREVGRLIGEADWSSPEARALVNHAIAMTH
ncbi:MAG: TlpA disulfide reductase family protein [Parvularculaceae bacterium]|nr:TlpA family protein disulfide reductase [Parvularculaceae bacterium]